MPFSGPVAEPADTVQVGHEPQRQAPARWPATLLRGGVPRVRTWRRRGVGASADSPRWVPDLSEPFVSVAPQLTSTSHTPVIVPAPDQRWPGAEPLLPVVGADLQAPLVTGGAVRYANLDYAASAPALEPVSARVAEVLPYYASVHRGAGYASQVSTALLERSRTRIGEFVGARADDVVVLTRNTTDALNLLARCVPTSGDVVFLDAEHHANLLRWQRGPHRCVPVQHSLEATLRAVEETLAAQPAALLAVTGASNVTGEELPVERLAQLAHRYGGRIAVDAAQLAPHRRIDLASLDVDYVAFSGHKLYAPYGAGALVGRRDWLDRGTPYLAGGGAGQRGEGGRTGGGRG